MLAYTQVLKFSFKKSVYIWFEDNKYEDNNEKVLHIDRGMSINSLKVNVQFSLLV